MLEQRLFCNIFNLTKPPIKVQIGKYSGDQLVSTHSSKILLQIVETSAPRVRGPSTNSHEGQRRNCKAGKQKQDSLLSRERSEGNHNPNYHLRRVYDLSATELSVFLKVICSSQCRNNCMNTPFTGEETDSWRWQVG